MTYSRSPDMVPYQVSKGLILSIGGIFGYEGLMSEANQRSEYVLNL